MRLLRIAAAVAAMAAASSAQSKPPVDTPEIETQLGSFVKAFAAIEANAADPVSSDQAIYGGAIPGMLRTLDPHSTFLDPQQFEQLKQMERSEQKGFGSVVSVLPGRVIVLQTLPGTPSAKAGLSAGDEILGINGYALSQLTFDQLVQLLTIARQKEARLDVRRPGNARLLQFVLVPQVLESPSVDREFIIEPGIGFVRATSFDPQTAKLLKAAIENLGGAKLNGLVLDLRNNPGGVVPGALEVASMFLQPGQKILSVKGRATQGEEALVPKTAEPYTFRLAVLVDGKTASAAEIVTGALQDNKRAVVVGEPTYGKGLVQSVFTLSGNTALALTTAFYYTPSGKSIQRPLENFQLERDFAGNRGGITPNYVVAAESYTRLRAVLEASASYAAFASDYLVKHKIDDAYRVTGDVLDEFRVFLSQHQIQPNVGEWLADKDWIASRLEQEIFNLSMGVARGDQVEMRRDPVVRRALAVLHDGG